MASMKMKGPKAPSPEQLAEKDRPQVAKPRDDGAKGAAAPTAGSAVSSMQHTDHEEAQPVQSLDPAHRLSTPSELKPDTAHGHSPAITWPENAESQAPRPFRNLK